MLLPIKRMLERVETARSDSDTAFFYDLMLLGELLAKLMVAGLIAGIEDDRNRVRYGQIYNLVRASGVGDWSSAADEILFGPAAQHLCPETRNEQRELTQKVASGQWQYDSVAALHRCVLLIDPSADALNVKTDGRRWLSYFAKLRNRKAHGALPADVLLRLVPDLESSLRLFATKFILFNRDWGYVHRNLSGKYRVTSLSETGTLFDPLKGSSGRAVPLVDGVYVFLDQPRRVELIETTVDANDFFLANGGFTDKRFEMLSYISGTVLHKDSAPYLVPPGPLPRSETEGLAELEVCGRSFTNLPPKPSAFVPRPALETELSARLRDPDRHPVLTLHGRGGMGKTSLALKVLNEVCAEGTYEVVIWFSARDIDLVTNGAKQVKPKVFTAAEIAAEFIRLTDEGAFKTSGIAKQTDYFAQALSKSQFGPTLYVFDNFETLRNPAELYTWIDTYIRPPNKVLITARHRDFKGDYPIEVLGMTEGEANELIDQHSTLLGIRHIIEDSYREELYRESGGHPYVIKVLLGEVAKAHRCIDIEKIVADRDDILTALFERTFAVLSPAAKRVFLTLCNWRSTIPQLALEAVMLRPGIEKLD